MIDLKPACAQLNAVLGGIAADQLTAPTPCAEYSVGDLIHHMDQVCRGSVALDDEAPLLEQILAITGRTP